jgi:diguanylate cyclase (GGDEF)-like protein/PAS domain S-box-containing protein
MDRDSTSRPVAIVASGREERDSTLRAILTAAGFSVVRARDSSGALAVMADNDDALLAFVDVDIDGRGGPTTLEVVRAMQSRLAVYVVTNDHGEDTAITAMEAGARGILLDRHLGSPIVGTVAAEAISRERLERSIRLAEAAALESEYRYRTLFGLARNPMFMVDVDGTVIEANEVARDLLAPNESGLVGCRLVDLIPRASDRDRIRSALAFDSDDGDVVLQVSRTDGDGHDRVFTMVARPHRDVFGQPQGLFCSVAPPREMGPGTSFALLFVEIADIDVLEAPGGHPTGDDIAAALSTRLGDTVREGDIVSRVGLDEFVVLLGEIEEQKLASVVIERIRRQLSEPLTIGDRRVRLECSIGGRSRGTGISPFTPESPARLDDADVVLLEFPRRREGGTIVGGSVGQSDPA